jgi:UDP-N-acetylmuramoyl-tripeptide--D-alanyl-D-alanine ligase
VAVLGEMRELGDHTEAAHTELGQVAAAVGGIDLVIAIGPYAHLVRDGALAAGLPPERVVVTADHAEAGECLRAAVGAGDLILVKGSRGAALEAVLAHLEPRGTV